MMKPKIEAIPEESIPEVLQYQEAKGRLENWKSTYPGAYEELKEILELVNTTGENAEKVVRAREVTCGPFTLKHYTMNTDANALYDAVGQEDFQKFGGSIQTVRQYDVDKKVFEALVVQKKIHPDVVEKVVTYSPAFTVPKKFQIP